MPFSFIRTEMEYQYINDELIGSDNIARLSLGIVLFGSEYRRHERRYHDQRR